MILTVCLVKYIKIKKSKQFLCCLDFFYKKTKAYVAKAKTINNSEIRIVIKICLSCLFVLNQIKTNQININNIDT